MYFTDLFGFLGTSLGRSCHRFSKEKKGVFQSGFPLPNSTKVVLNPSRTPFIEPHSTRRPYVMIPSTTLGEVSRDSCGTLRLEKNYRL